jgi:hypothetical protein
MDSQKNTSVPDSLVENLLHADSMLQSWQKEKYIDFNIPISKYRSVYIFYSNVLGEMNLTHTLPDNYIRSIFITLPRFVRLISLKAEIDKAIADTKTSTNAVYKRHIGGNIYVSVSSKYHTVDIRQFANIDSELTATRVGIALHYAEWYFLNQSYKYIQEVLPLMKNLKHCSQTHDLENIEETFHCRECFPM